MPSAVLDLGAMAVLVGTVALGLEKISMEKNPLSEQLQKLQTKIARAITELDTEISYIDRETKKLVIEPLCKTGEFHFLLIIAGNPEQQKYGPWSRFVWAIQRTFWSAPLLPVMRHNIHRPFLFALTIISVLCFLFQKAGEVYEFDHLGSIYGLQDVCLYWVYSTTIAVTLLCAIAAHRLSTVERRCLDTLNKLRKQKEHDDEIAHARMMRELRNFASSHDAGARDGADPSSRDR